MQFLKSLIFTLVCYVVYVAVVVYYYGDPTEDSAFWAWVVLGASLGLFLVWCLLGAFVLRPNSGKWSWPAVWWVLAVVLVAIIVYSYFARRAAKATIRC